MDLGDWRGAKNDVEHHDAHYDEHHDDVEHPIIRLARHAVEAYVLERTVIPLPDDLAPELTERAGVFVSIKKRGELRGCIGTFEPTQANVAAEIIQNAINSATRDPRFPPARRDELAFLDYSVDLLSKPEPVTDLSKLDPRRWGVLVVSGGRRGLLLPDLDGIDAVEKQLEIARYKAGIMPDERVEIFRFEVRRFR